MRVRGIRNWLAALSLALAVGALALLLSWQDVYRGRSMLEEYGPRAFVWVIPPVALSLAGFLASLAQTRMGKVGTRAAAILLLVFALATGWGYGWAFLPAAFALVVAAATAGSVSSGRSPA